MKNVTRELITIENFNQSRLLEISFGMILLTRLNRTTIYLNPDMIKSIEETPDTTICLMNGDYFLVLERATEVVEKIIDYRVTIQRRLAQPDGLIRPGGAPE